MRGLETISPTRQSGRGPDSSLKRQLIFIWTRLQHCVDLGTVTQLCNSALSLYTLYVKLREIQNTKLRMHGDKRLCKGIPPASIVCEVEADCRCNYTTNMGTTVYRVGRVGAKVVVG